MGVLMLSCDTSKDEKSTEIIEGLPTMRQVADSLNLISAQCLKWSIVDDEIIRAEPEYVDWTMEFQAFLNDNVNHIRYKDAYNVSDSGDAQLRCVRFEAKSEDQEIRYVELTIDKGRLSEYAIEKSRSKLYSNSLQRFTYTGNTYTLEVLQSIEGIFENTQYLCGEILPAGDLWRCEFNLGERKLPVLVVETTKGDLYLKNGEELVLFERAGSMGDSVIFKSPLFRSSLILSKTDSVSIHGRWVQTKYDKEYCISLEMKMDRPWRFDVKAIPKVDVSGSHTIVFEGADTDTAALMLRQNKHIVSGSVLTPTGDYRFLEGVIRGDSLFLSAMDGTHAYFFESKIEGSEMEGVFRSGKTYKRSWKAFLHEPFALPDAESTTELLPGQRFSFEFPDESGKWISLSDKSFENRVVLVSLMGTWCTNCLDEIRFLKEVESAHSAADLAVVGLDFELTSDSAAALVNIRNYREALDIDFPILLAAVNATKEGASRALPMLNGVFAYPTLVVLDRDHRVVRIHTGFSGPATGEKHYNAFKTRYFGLINDLVGKPHGNK